MHFATEILCAICDLCHLSLNLVMKCLLSLLLVYFSDQGDCQYDTTLLAGICHCDPDWIGDDCFIPCINGTNHGDGVCDCDRTCDTGKFTFFNNFIPLN